MSSALDRIRDCAELWSEHPMTTVETKDLALLLAVVNAVKKYRLKYGTSGAYDMIYNALSALTENTGAA